MRYDGLIPGWMVERIAQIDAIPLAERTADDYAELSALLAVEATATENAWITDQLTGKR